MSPSLKIEIQLKIEKVIEVIGGKQIKMTMITDIIRFDTAYECFLTSFHSIQNTKTAAIAIRGKIQAIINFMNTG